MTKCNVHEHCCCFRVDSVDSDSTRHYGCVRALIRSWRGVFVCKFRSTRTRFQFKKTLPVEHSLEHCRYTMVVLWGIVVPHIAHASYCDTSRDTSRMRHHDRSVFNHGEKRRKPVFLKHDHLFKNKEDVVTVDKTDEVEDQKVSPQFRFIC